MSAITRFIVRVFSGPNDAADDIFPVLMFTVIGLLVAIALVYARGSSSLDLSLPMF
jgi:hypothetical protein